MTAAERVVRSAAQVLRDCPLPPPEKRSLLAHALGVARERLIAHPEAAVDGPAFERFVRLAGERQAGMPMAYLLGWQEFYGLRLRVTPAVLIPRPETELLVECTLESIDPRREARVLDLGTGSGCIALALARERPHWRIVATDRSPAALQVARDNARRLGAPLALLAADWYAPILGQFDLIVSNPPYIARHDQHLALLRQEPRGALTDEGDGLGDLRRVVAGAPGRLAAGGRLLFEHGYDQGAAARELMREHGFDAVRTHRDLEGRERVCEGVCPGRWS